MKDTPRPPASFLLRSSCQASLSSCPSQRKEPEAPGGLHRRPEHLEENCPASPNPAERRCCSPLRPRCSPPPPYCMFALKKNLKITDNLSIHMTRIPGDSAIFLPDGLKTSLVPALCQARKRGSSTPLEPEAPSPQSAFPSRGTYPIPLSCPCIS
jgi:hypothetical protein